MKTAILLGAGSSIPAGFPSTKDLTDRVLSCKDIYKDTNQLYHMGDFAGHPSFETTELVKEMMQKLFEEAECYYPPDKTINYEDIFYLAVQVRDHLWGEMENPAVKPFAQDRIPRQTWLRVEQLLREDWSPQIPAHKRRQNRWRRSLQAKTVSVLIKQNRVSLP